MIIAFCGHSEFQETEEVERELLAFLEEKVGDAYADMYLGGYGSFDSFAYTCCKKYKETHKNVSLILVTPYLDIEYQKSRLETQKFKYDAIIYPELEKKPKRFAITYRNKYMVEKADYVVAYVSRGCGGAYMTYKHAKRKGKQIYNLSVKEF